MKFGLVAGFCGLGILVAMAISSLGLFASGSGDFIFPASDGKGALSYRCADTATTRISQENARAAHALFEPALQETARIQAKAIVIAMTSNSVSAEVITELQALIAEADARRKKLHQEIQQKFGCVYRGST